MKSFCKTLFLILLLCSNIWGQPFQVTDPGLRDYTLNKFDKIVYAKENFYGIVYEYYLKTGVSKQSQLLNLPTFANKSRKAVYEKNKLLYLYNFPNDSTYLLGQVSSYSPFLSFSPNDTGLLVIGNDTLTYYTFTNNMISRKSSALYTSNIRPSWITDTSLVVTNGGQNVLLKYNVLTKVIDTLFAITKQGMNIYGVDYNPSINSVAISYEYSLQASIHLLNLSTKEDKRVVNLVSDFPKIPCIGAPIVFEEFKWSPDYKKLFFFGNYAVSSAGGIYTYYLDSNKTRLFTNCADYGLKNNVVWQNNDTILYSNATTYRVYGFTVPQVFTSIKREENGIPSSFRLYQNYPNPFNPTTNISFSIPQRSNVRLVVYDALGREVTTLANKVYEAGKYEVQFNGNNLASGMYFYTLTTLQGMISKKMLLVK